MKRPSLSNDFIPVGKFKASASKVINSIMSENRSVVITQGGEPVAVLITPQEFDNFVSKENVVTAVNEGLQDYAAGRYVEDDQVERIMREHHSKNKK